MVTTRTSTPTAAMLQERARIARDLHDSVSQTLYAIALTASRARCLLEQNENAEVRRFLDAVLQLAEAGQSELRALMTNLRSDSQTCGGLIAGITDLAADFRTRHCLDIRLSLGHEPILPATTSEALLMISREALRNVVKHAGADRVDIVLQADSDEMVLLITDNGRGCDPAADCPGHFGLQSMHERAAAVGAKLELFSLDGVGTQVRVRIPQARGR